MFKSEKNKKYIEDRVDSICNQLVEGKLFEKYKTLAVEFCIEIDERDYKMDVVVDEKTDIKDPLSYYKAALSLKYIYDTAKAQTSNVLSKIYITEVHLRGREKK